MGIISKATIQKITDEARVEDVVGEFVNLKKRGSNLLGLCPFHNEKTPSFNVNPARNIYKCFGCGKAGGPLQFLMDYQQLAYPDALRYLAKKYNIEIEETQDETDQKQQQEKQNLAESILIANTRAQKFFTDYMFNNEAGAVGLAYFRERGFRDNTIEKFQLGYAPDAGSLLTQTMLKEGFQLDILKKAGLTSPKEGSTYDFFRNRVMFPIHNMTGKVVAYGGRIMGKDEKAPKYVNTAESDVYQKSKILYGVNFAKTEIRKRDECLMVEGYTDVISLHQAGIENVVSSSGTSLTVEQIRLIKRITPNITMLYDGDAAGIKAALRGTDLILEEGMNVRIVILPNPEDPDSYVRKVGTAAFLKYISENKKDLILFKTSLFAHEAKSDPIKRAELIRDIVESIAKIPDSIQRQVYVKGLSQLFEISEQLLITEVNKLRQLKQKEQQKTRDKDFEKEESKKQEYTRRELDEEIKAQSTLPILEHNVIRVLLEFGSWKIPTESGETTVVQYIFEEFEGLDIEAPMFKVIYDLIRTELAEGRVHEEKFFTGHDDEKVWHIAVNILSQPYFLSNNWLLKYKVTSTERKDRFMKDVQSVVVRFKQFKNNFELVKIQKLMVEAKDEKEMTRLIKLHMLLIEQKKELAKTIGNVIWWPNK